jgi:hypothetical protein
VPRVSSHTARFTPREFYSVTRSTFRDGLRRCAIDGGSGRLEDLGGTSFEPGRSETVDAALGFRTREVTETFSAKDRKLHQADPAVPPGENPRLCCFAGSLDGRCVAREP